MHQCEVLIYHQPHRFDTSYPFAQLALAAMSELPPSIVEQYFKRDGYDTSDPEVPPRDLDLLARWKTVGALSDFFRLHCKQ